MGTRHVPVRLQRWLPSLCRVLEVTMVSCQNPVLLLYSAQGLLCYAVKMLQAGYKWCTLTYVRARVAAVRLFAPPSVCYVWLVSDPLLTFWSCSRSRIL